MSAGTQIDFSKYAEPSAPQIDFSKYDGSQQDRGTIGPPQSTAPFAAPAGSGIAGKFVASIPGEKFAADAIDKLRTWANFTPEGAQQHPVQAQIGQLADRAKQMLVGGQGGGLNMQTGFLTNPVTSAVTGAPSDEAINAARSVVQGAARLPVSAYQAVRNFPTKVAEMAGKTIAPEAANVAPAVGQLQPALNVTPNQIVQYAAQKGIDLTPAEASATPVAKTIQAVGERSLLGGDQLAQARQANALKLAQNVRSLAETADPKGMGLTEEGAGEAIQQSARTARDVAHENATDAYSQAATDQQNLAGDVTPLKQMVQDQTMVRQPGAAVARPQYQQPEVQAAFDDIGSKPDQLGPNPSIQSMRNLRTEFLERSRTAPGEAQTAAQRLYGQAADTVDSQIMKAAEGTPFEDSFRDASQQWQALKSKFDEPGTVLNRILSQRDPATITRSILNRGSANDIQILQNENMGGAIDALKRQTLQDIANRGFRVNGDGLGGYSDSFLNQLFGPDMKQELYVNGELARRMGFQLNPSGTSNVLLGMEQLSPNPTRAMIPMGAARTSMPRPAASYLPQGTVPLKSLSNP